jgi:hypothetical protein
VSVVVACIVAMLSAVATASHDDDLLRKAEAASTVTAEPVSSCRAQRLQGKREHGLGGDRAAGGKALHVCHHGLSGRGRASGGSKTLEVTESHRLYSVSRGDFVPAIDLYVGEVLQTAAGEVTVSWMDASSRAPQLVYNLAVGVAERYYVGDRGILAHNNCAEGASNAAKAAEGAGDARGAGVVENGARGRASEARVPDDMGLKKNSTPVATAEGTSVPDALTDAVSVEVKDRARVSATRQIRIQTGAARAAGRQSVLVTGRNTKVSEPARRAFDQVIQRSDMGPQ